MVIDSEQLAVSSQDNEEAEHIAKPVNEGQVTKPWLFQKGSVPNPYGRKGNPDKKTPITELRRRADKKAGPLADALIKSALTGNTRAWVAIRDTAYGVPAQKLVVERADDPLERWMAAISGVPAPIPALPPPVSPASQSSIDP